MPMGDLLRNKVLMHTLGQTALPMETSVYIALFTALPTSSTDFTNEYPNQDAYARKNAITSLGVASNGTISNTANIPFDRTTGSGWTGITHACIVNSATHGAGEILYVYTFPTVLEVIFDEYCMIEIGEMEILIDA